MYWEKKIKCTMTPNSACTILNAYLRTHRLVGTGFNPPDPYFDTVDTECGVANRGRRLLSENTLRSVECCHSLFQYVIFDINLIETSILVDILGVNAFSRTQQSFVINVKFNWKHNVTDGHWESILNHNIEREAEKMKALRNWSTHDPFYGGCGKYSLYRRELG